MAAASPHTQTRIKNEKKETKNAKSAVFFLENDVAKRCCDGFVLIRFVCENVFVVVVCVCIVLYIQVEHILAVCLCICLFRL